MDGWSLISLCAAAATASLGLFWSQRRFLRAASRSGAVPSHCPVCAYDLAGLESTICPECGLDTHESHLAHRIRAALSSCAPAIASLILAGMLAIAPLVARHGPLAFIPTSALIVMLPWASGDAAPLHDELTGRIRAGTLAPMQGRMLAARCADIIENHSQANRRAGAAGVLGASPDRSASTAAAVAAALRHPDEAVRLAVIPAAATLATTHPSVRGTLLAMVADDASELSRARAVDALRRCGSLNRTEAVVLTVAASSESPRIRQRAVYAIGAAPPNWERSRGTLARAAADADAGVREAALAVLSNRAHSDAAAIPILTGGLADPSPELRIWTASRLRLLGVNALKALPALFAATTDRDDEVRAAAGDAIASILRNSISTLS